MKKFLATVVMFLPFLVYAAGNPSDGKTKSMVCAACHGPTGISSIPLYPNIAGQHESYLIKQLHDFKKGELRNAPMMTPMVQSLSNQDIEDLAAFYAAQKPAAGMTPKKYLALGERLYRGGDRERQITACIACHGPQGTGNAQAKFPSLSGQVPAYMIAQLEAFKAKTRKNDLNGIMQDISHSLDKEDMEALANYCSGLH